MGSLATDTAVTRNGRGFTADLSPDWEIWGPNGGYLAAVALRAAGIVSARARPASISVHFVGAGRSGPVAIDVTTNRATKVASSVTVTMTQDDRPWLVAIVWGVDDDLDGLDHHTADRPVLPPPDALQSVRELAGDGAVSPHPFWANLDMRPLSWIDDWDAREPSEPEVRTWYRFVPDATFDDPWVDAGRLLIVADVDSWPAAGRPHVGELAHFAPTIELTVRFLGDTRGDGWLLGHAVAPVAAGGLIGAGARVWTTDGRLVALGGSTLLCRPAVRRPDR